MAANHQRERFGFSLTIRRIVARGRVQISNHGLKVSFILNLRSQVLKCLHLLRYCGDSTAREGHPFAHCSSAEQLKALKNSRPQANCSFKHFNFTT